ncbi:ABC transporter ATP-binding protein [Intestinibacter bartlettii]|uniref:ABC transporter ATP-binding protein n=1 Tax=Intestinibacter bartlettii TaxID=261299 RepID=UPI001D11D3CF|nr:ABC transporter ATP-binding protein [Intestinibacter bartlettii]MCC2706300.1 ABC transporter ATP-binding protein [Intestinibacter bartlettii]MCC2761750.1 ABC transporter ATP-binding protein [Intestinibacter bartlettii]
MILDVKNLTKTFEKNNTVFTAVDNVNFQLDKKECLGIVGESGSGKSTIAKMLVKLLEPDNGEINFLGKDLVTINNLELRKTRKDIQMIFQNPMDSFNPRKKLKTSVGAGLKYTLGLNKKEIDEKVDEALNLVGLKSEYKDRYINKISGGECQRAAIARSIIIEPKLLICDEITSALDVSVQAQIIDLLVQLREKMDMSYIFITHDLTLARYLCDRILVIYKGNEVESGNAKDIFENPMHPYTKLLLSCIMTIDNIDENKNINYEKLEHSGGCKFKDMCPNRMDICDSCNPEIKEIGNRKVRCHMYNK